MDMEYLKHTLQVSSDSARPIYQQIADSLKRMVRMGKLKEGDQVPPELTICEALNVSRSTVRMAMSQLIDEGLIIRHRGKGSYIAGNQMHRPINYLYNFTENMRELGATPSSIVLGAEVVEAPSESVRQKLQLPGGDAKVFHLNRIRCANEVPMLVESTFIPYYLCEGIEHYDFSTMSLYYVLATHYALNTYHATETIEATNMSEEDIRLLKCPKNIPAFRIRRISHTDTGLVYEYTVSISRADKNIFRMELYKNQNVRKVPVNVQRNFSL